MFTALTSRPRPGTFEVKRRRIPSSGWMRIARRLGFGSIAADLLGSHPAGAVLAAHDRPSADLIWSERRDGSQDLDLLVTQGVGLERGRRLHCNEAHELHEVVLE